MSIPSSTNISADHSRWMLQAIALARKATALAHPNPMVGAVLVKDGRSVGEGFHIFDRLDHAEIVALNQAGANARGAVLYLSLEPCCTTGRTGPCTKAIIEAGVKKVYVAMKDPNPRVAGGGLAILKRAGIDVQLLGDHRPSAQQMNEDFAKWIRTGQPFVTLKSAMTLDGHIASSAGRSAGRPTAITGKESHALVQRIRHSSDALVTGIGTVLADNPLLTDRTGEPRRQKLLRIVLDSRLRLPLKSKLVESAQDDVLVFTHPAANSPKARALEKAGVEVFHVPAKSSRGQIDLREVLRELAKRQMLSVLIEAGAEVNGSALEAGIVDKLILFYAPRVMLAGGVPFARASSKATARLSSRALENAPPLMNVTLDRCGGDFVIQGYFRDVYRDHGTRRKN